MCPPLDPKDALPVAERRPRGGPKASTAGAGEAEEAVERTASGQICIQHVIGLGVQ